MLEHFRAAGNAVLFGVDSFWQGVDVPGEALSNVIITKLPFAVPDRPLIEARHRGDRGGGRQAVLRLPGAAGGHQAEAGLRPADPHAHRHRHGGHPRSARADQGLWPVVPATRCRTAGGSWTGWQWRGSERHIARQAGCYHVTQPRSPTRSWPRAVDGLSAPSVESGTALLGFWGVSRLISLIPESVPTRSRWETTTTGVASP